MTDCKAYRVMASYIVLQQEIVRLANELPSALGAHNIELNRPKTKPETSSDGHIQHQVAYSFKASGKLLQSDVLMPERARKPRKPTEVFRQLLFNFDLWRPAAKSDWPHAQRSLLTVAYAADFDAPWDAANLRLDQHGRFGWYPDGNRRETHEHGRLHDGGRLFEYREEQKQDDPWKERAWAFSVPLIALVDRMAFTKEIAVPVVKILKRDAKEGAAGIFNGSAVAFGPILIPS